MAGKNPASPVLDEADAAFIEGGVSIIASSRTADNVPVTARAVGCRISADRRALTLLFPRASCEELLGGIRVSQQIAVVFSQPGTHQTIQVKGTDAVPSRVHKQDAKSLEQYRDAFVADVCPLGYPEPLVRALLWFDPNELSAVTFTPSEAFLQTPGPRAGAPLKGGIHAQSG